MRFLHLAPAGAALDLACGAGRHGRLLLARGHRTTLLDRDLSGVTDLALHPDAELIEADLEDGAPFPLAGRQFATLIVTNYLHRPLFDALMTIIAPGGLLLYETFALGNERYGRPRNPDFLLRPGELIEACRDLHIVAYEHGIEEGGDAGPSVRQRICAMRTDGPVRLAG